MARPPQNQQEAYDWHVEVFGFKTHTDVTMGEGYRGLTVVMPDHPELEVTLMKTGPPLDEEMTAVITRQLHKENMGGRGLRVHDCMKTCEELRAKASRPFRSRPIVPTASRPSSATSGGNWLVLVEPNEFS